MITMGSALTYSSPQPFPQKSEPSPLHGILNIRKPSGWTSHDVVLYLRRKLGISKIGHAGTLDPAATGVLPVLVGKGTKIADHLLGWEKEYRAVLRLGQSTDTQDVTGRVVQEVSAVSLSEKEIHTVIDEFQGVILQVPPMYSAVKVGGKPLYKAARRGETVKRNPRPVTIYQLEVLAVRGRDVDLRVVCSKGTYIRTLCADIGDRLEVGGHLFWLERSRVGPCHVQDALDIEEVVELHFSAEVRRVLMSIDSALSQYPVVTVKAEDVRKVVNGAPIPVRDVQLDPKETMVPMDNGQHVRIRDPLGRLLAIGTLGSPRLDLIKYEKEEVICVETLCIET